MHTDLSLHLHTPECVELIKALHQCHAERKFSQYFGTCNRIDVAVWQCLKKERLEKRRRNYEETTERRRQASLEKKRLREEAKKNNSSANVD